MSDNTLTILVVEPMKPPYVKQIPDNLQAMQKLVGGDIDATYPFPGPVAFVFNGEGKLNGLPPNRFLRTEDGKPYDIVCGTFFLAGLGEENFVSYHGTDRPLSADVQPGDDLGNSTKRERKNGT